MRVPVIFLTVVAAAFCQQDPVIRLKVREVLVPVTVLDSKGRHVEGLRTADFHLYEDDAPQRIVASSVSTVTATRGGSPPRTMPAAEPEPGVVAQASAPSQSRTYVICFDGMHTSAESFSRSRVALEKFLRTNPEGSPRVALVNVNTRIQVMQTATSDMTLIRRRLESKDFAASSGSPDRLDFEAALNEVKERMERYCGRCPCGRAITDSPGDCKQTQEQIRQDLDTKSTHFAVTAKTFLTGLRVLLDEEAKLGGLTSLVLVSDGFTLQPGRELYAVASAWLPNSANFAFQPPRDLQPSLDEVIHSAVQSNITIESIDSRGVYNPSFLPGGIQDASTAQMGRSAAANRGGTLHADMDSKMSSIAFSNASALKQIADATGGEFHHNSNDLRKAFAGAFFDGQEFYVLVYSPAHPAVQGAFHSIRVEVAGHPGATVLAKKGYFDNEPQ